MSFQFLKFSSSKRSSLQNQSSSNLATPHIKLQEDEYPENLPFPNKQTAKPPLPEFASTETTNFFNTFQSPQSLNLANSPTSPADIRNMLPKLNLANPVNSNPKVEPQLVKDQKSFSQKEESNNTVSKVLQDYSPTPSPPKISDRNTISEFNHMESEDVNNEQGKDEGSRSGILGGSFMDSRRAFLIDEKSASARKQDNVNSKASYGNCDENAITEEEHNMSLCSVEDDQAQKIDFFAKQSSGTALKTGNSGFGMIRNLNLNLDLPQPNGSQTHRGRREEIRIDVVNGNVKVSDEVDAHLSDEDEVEVQPEARVVTFSGQVPHSVQERETVEVRETVTTVTDSGPDMQKLADKDARLYLRKACALLVMIIVASLLLGLMINQNESYRRLFIALYAFLAYFALETGIRLRSPETQIWKKQERICEIMQVGAALFLLICIDLNLMGILSFVIIAFVPLLLVTIIYSSVSTAPRSTKDIRALSKFLYTLQAFLIVMKLNGYLNWGWEAVFVIAWIYFSFSAIYALIIIILLFVVIFVAIFKLQTYTLSNLIIRVIGLLWYSAYHGLGIFVIANLVGATETYESLTLIRYACYLMLAYTVIMFIPLKKFIKTFDRNQEVISNSDNDPLIQNIHPKHVLDFQVEKASSYFFMLSSTYFLPLHQGFLSKSKERFQKIRSLKKMSSYSKSGDILPDSTINLNKDTVIQELRKDKELLDQKLDVPIKLQSLKRGGSGHKQHGHYSQRDNEKTLQGDKEQNSDAYDLKLFVSADDINLLKDVSPICKTRVGVQDEERTCYICFERGPDAVLMECGHGGVCCGCAISMLKEKNECMECRKPVKAVYKVDKSLRKTGIVKVSELTKVVEIKLAP